MEYRFEWVEEEGMRACQETRDFECAYFAELYAQKIFEDCKVCGVEVYRPGKEEYVFLIERG